MSDPVVQAVRAGPVLQLSLNRPQALNALNREMAVALRAELAAAAGDPSVRLVVLQGAGDRGFCGGADIGEMVGGSKAEVEETVAILEEILHRVVTLPCPVLAVVGGHALGAGAYLMAACDLRIAAAEAKFHFGAVSYGLVLGTWILPRVVGPARAKDLLMTARMFSAAEAERMGLVQRLVPRGELAAAAAALTEQLVANHPAALQQCKQLLADLDISLSETRRREHEHNRLHAGNQEFRTRLGAVAAARAQRIEMGD